MVDYDKNETLELLDKLTVTYGALEHTLGRQRTEKIFREEVWLDGLCHSSDTGAATYRAAIRVWRKGIMAELDSKGYYVKRMADEIVRWG